MLDGISLGCNGRGVQHIAGEPITVDEQFRPLKSAGVYDHFDRMPQPGQEREYLDAANRHGIPIRTGLWSYVAGRDEAQLEKNLRVCKDAGGEFHNVMLYTRHARGHVVTEQDVLDFYLLSHELGQKIGIDIGFEVHIYMFSEDFRRITPLARSRPRRAWHSFRLRAGPQPRAAQGRQPRRAGCVRSARRCRKRSPRSRSLRARQTCSTNGSSRT